MREGQTGHVAQDRLSWVLDGGLAHQPVVRHPELAARLGGGAARFRAPLEQDHTGAFVGGGQCGRESGGATADDDDLRLVIPQSGVTHLAISMAAGPAAPAGACASHWDA